MEENPLPVCPFAQAPECNMMLNTTCQTVAHRFLNKLDQLPVMYRRPRTRECRHQVHLPQLSPCSRIIIKRQAAGEIMIWGMIQELAASDIIGAICEHHQIGGSVHLFITHEEPRGQVV